ncbi:carbohydrate ABC transporter permease [Paenibacillus rigui]|uniref:Sugar ABC transporter permease n=1 Tax=Paenibacillus rigui TaxID=554312 RepID=A0A229UQ53_9BACL|nr:carbohydrate ABC transporter permease [Paenibacillus rigui]OXM85411.1 sugar ABC transporter permease [Paenibacillus rigui]
MESQRIVETKTDRIFNSVNYIILALFTLTVLYPLVYVVSSSFSSAEAILSGRVWLWPVQFTLDGYQAVMDNNAVWRGAGNSVYYTVVGTFFNVVFTLMAAYPLSRKDFYIRHVLMFLYVFTMMFGGGLIPHYLVVKDLGLLDTRWALIIPGALTVMNVIIARTYFQSTIPDELFEAAQLDGCTDFQFLSKIVVPLSGPIIAVLCLFYAIGHWNSYFGALLYLSQEKLYPLQLVLREILVQNKSDGIDLTSDLQAEGKRELLKYALIVVSSFPVMIIYPFVQKHFVKGIMIGSLKG